MRRNSGVIAGVLLLSHIVAQAAITEFDQKALLYNTNYGRGVNWQAQGGVPAPTGATARQFQGALVYGAVSYQRLHPGTLVPNTNFNGQAEILDWPRSNPGDSLRVVLRLQAGAPYLSRQVSLFFGSAIPTPETDESGNLLSEILRSTYWNPEPHSTNGHAGAQYYWSPSARRVFAIQPGSVEVVWRKATPDAASHPGDTNYFAVGGNYFRLFSRRYVVSGNAVKTPRTIFWTEGVYGSTGKKVEVPEGRVKDVKFVYNNTFPVQVSSNQLVQPYPGPITPESTNTVWLQNGRFISAYNLEGRLFLELLGDGTASGVREHLGFEILDVKREAIPEDVVTELGERLTSYPNNVPSDAALTAEPMDPAAAAIYAYQHSGGASGREEYYAIQTTRNRSDLQMYWMEAGEQGIRWPLRLARYKLVWPDDVAKYSHYIRPPAQTDAEARVTAVPFPTANVPKIEFQDRDGNSRERAGLTEEFRFYTWLDATIPTHRTLLRFTAGNNIAFERVFSWLDENVRAGLFRTPLRPIFHHGIRSRIPLIGEKARGLTPRALSMNRSGWDRDWKRRETRQHPRWIGNTLLAMCNGVREPVIALVPIRIRLRLDLRQRPRARLFL